MKRWIRIWGFILALAITAGSLAGCNTVRGVGRDIQAGGRVVEKAAS